MTGWMLVMDNPCIRDLTQTAFEIWGIDGIIFADGYEAVRWIEDVEAGRVAGDMPDVAILDLHRAPGELSGADVGARLRKSGRLRDIAIVLTTSARLHGHRIDDVMQYAGADFFLPMPWPKFDELVSLIDEVVAQRAAPSKR
ncbi:MAG: response regulator [Anaerolineae bacterium]|nr:response regulator [Anaerolineae bacterium]